MNAGKKTGQTRKSAGRFLPLNSLIPLLPDIAQRFSKFRQTLQDFHQPLHGLIRRLKKFLQRLPDYAETATMPAARLVAFSHFRLSTLNF
jgi:hypothetical protein